MNTKKKNARGITLIALVITIIVLLILAGVTINALSGENGIITKSKEAKIKTEKSKTIEKINLAILTAMTKGNGDIDNATLREELEKEGLTVKTEGNNLPWDVSDGKYIYRINEDYTVEEVEGINLSKKEIKLASGENKTITATLTEGTTGKITWESSAPDIVKVENGKIYLSYTTSHGNVSPSVFIVKPSFSNSSLSVALSMSPFPFVIADNIAKLIFSSAFVFAVFSFASVAFVIIPFSPVKAFIAIPASISVTIIVITNAINVIPLVFPFSFCICFFLLLLFFLLSM